MRTASCVDCYWSYRPVLTVHRRRVEYIDGYRLVSYRSRWATVTKDNLRAFGQCAKATYVTNAHDTRTLARVDLVVWCARHGNLSTMDYLEYRVNVFEANHHGRLVSLQRQHLLSVKEATYGRSGHRAPSTVTNIGSVPKEMHMIRPSQYSSWFNLEVGREKRTHGTITVETLD